MIIPYLYINSQLEEELDQLDANWLIKKVKANKHKSLYHVYQAIIESIEEIVLSYQYDIHAETVIQNIDLENYCKSVLRNNIPDYDRIILEVYDNRDLERLLNFSKIELIVKISKLKDAASNLVNAYENIVNISKGI